MTQPPPQYILPPASLPLVPVRPSPSPTNGGDMRSLRAPSGGSNNSNERRNDGVARERAGSDGAYERGGSNSGNSASVATGDDADRHGHSGGSVYSGHSDAENIMGRGNGCGAPPPPTSAAARQVQQRRDSLKKDGPAPAAPKAVVPAASGAPAEGRGVPVGGGGSAEAGEEEDVRATIDDPPFPVFSKDEEDAPNDPRHNIAPPTPPTEEESLQSDLPSANASVNNAEDEAPITHDHDDAEPADIRIGRTGNPVGSMGYLYLTGGGEDGDVDVDGEGDPDVDHAEIRIGSTGNPVGSMGYLYSPDLEGAEEAEGSSENELAVVDAGKEEASNVPENDDISRSTGNGSNVTHFPLEISTDDGGVSALLPSGRILVDAGAIGTASQPGATAGERNQVAEAANRLLGRMKCDDMVLENCDGGDMGNTPLLDAPSLGEGSHSRASQGPASLSGRSSRGEERSSSSSRRGSHSSLQAPPQRLPQSPKFSSKEEEVGDEGDEVFKESSPSLDEDEEATPPSLLQAATSSSVSDDPTFNSYAASELSSMMSHLELQHLLKQGRQQEQDYDMFHGSQEDRISGGTPPRRPPDIASGAAGKGQGVGVTNGNQIRPPMVLYANQSLYARRKRRDQGGTGRGGRGEGEGGRPTGAMPTMPPLSAEDSPQDFPPVPSALSSSSHCLQRVDAMDDERSALSRQVANARAQPLTPSARLDVDEDDYFRIPHPRSSRDQEQFYPHLLGQPSTLTTMPSMSSTITTVQSARHLPGQGNYVAFQPHIGPGANSYLAPPQEVAPPEATLDQALGGNIEENEDTFFHELKSASPLRSCASTSPSVNEDNCSVEVSLKKQESNLSGHGARSPAVLSLDGAGSNRTSSTGNGSRKSVQSLLGTSTKSLADDLIQDSSGEGEDADDDCDDNDDNRGLEGEKSSSAAATSLPWDNECPQTGQVPFPHAPLLHVDPSTSIGDDDDGYSADRSAMGYTLNNANGIEECSTVDGGSYLSHGGQRDLRPALPMAGSDDTENSHHHRNFGYGHAYNTEPLSLPPRHPGGGGPMMGGSGMVLPPTFPSLMDSSVSSALTEYTAPSRSGTGMGFGCDPPSHQQQHRSGGIEEREAPSPLVERDCLALPQGVPAASPSATHAAMERGQSAARSHEDPLASAVPSLPPTMPLTMPLVEDDRALTIAVHDHAAPPPPSSGIIDPRMVVDYERHYIVDLERINEESSGHYDLSSAGGGRKFASGSISSPRASAPSSPRASAPGSPSSPRASTRSPSIPEAYASGPPQKQAYASNQQQNQAYASGGQPHPQQHLAQQLSQVPDSPQPHQFYDYRHQYYTEQYHYCDERFSQASNRRHMSEATGDDDTDSTCSSVTLSQAFRHSRDGDESACSSITETECYSQSHATTSPSMVSTVSSVTLSRALSVDKHEHSQGFYVATRLGDFVEVPADEGPGEEIDGFGLDGGLGPAEMYHDDAPAYFRTVYEEDDESASIEVEKNVDPRSPPRMDYPEVQSSHPGILGLGPGAPGDGAEDYSKSATAEDETIDVTSTDALVSKGHLDDEHDLKREKEEATAKAAKAAAAHIASARAEDVKQDMLSALVPECGAPIPSVMARVANKPASSVTRSRGGYLLPWHSTRSIQNYHGRRGGSKTKKGGSGSTVYSNRSSQGSIFSIGSVHTFRG